MNMTMLDWYLTINRQLGYHFLPFNQVILMLNQSFDGMHTNQITKVKIHGNKVFNMQQEANNFLMSLSRIFCFPLKYCCQHVKSSLWVHKLMEGRSQKNQSYEQQTPTPSSIGCVISSPKAQALWWHAKWYFLSFLLCSKVGTGDLPLSLSLSL